MSTGDETGLIRAGKTVGVASNSHKVIDNVLQAFEERLTAHAGGCGLRY
jgi:hypothetical protein